jgi:SAM-dependent methyltransferase
MTAEEYRPSRCDTVVPPKQRRGCEICGSTDRVCIYSQRFVPYDGAVLLDGYDVVVCKGCGFGYADGIPDQAEFDAYYRDLSKYEPREATIPNPAPEAARHNEVAERIKEFLPSRTARILEIGCASGTLLGILKRDGYENVVGLDPSPACAEAANRRHGVQVIVGSLFSAAVPQRSFDLVITTGVLEHVRDLNRGMTRISSLLTDEGGIFSCVPDVARLAAFPNAPFQAFSVEHINFFSLSSLANLLQKFGFRRLWAGQGSVSMGSGVAEPVIHDISRRTRDSYPVQPALDPTTESSLIEYVRLCSETDKDLQDRVEHLVSGQGPLLVWGVGTHTQRLLASGGLRDAKIVAFVDSNPHYQGRTLNGIPIISPEAVRRHAEPILVSSRTCQQVIAQQIQVELRLPNELLTLYDKR